MTISEIYADIASRCEDVFLVHGDLESDTLGAARFGVLVRLPDDSALALEVEQGEDGRVNVTARTHHADGRKPIVFETDDEILITI